MSVAMKMIIPVDEEVKSEDDFCSDNKLNNS